MLELVEKLTQLPLFGVGISVLAYEFGVFCNRKLKTPLANSVLIADLLIVFVLLVFRIPYESYAKGGEMIELFLAPATAALAVKIYQQLELLKKDWLPVIIGSAVGAAVSICCVILMCHLLSLNDEITYSLFPKSVTTAIALPISAQLGGIRSITVLGITITGIMGAVFAPVFIKVFRVDNSVAAGVAIGTSSHALGTTKAIEIGDVEGAMSGISIGIAGLATVIYAMFM